MSDDPALALSGIERRFRQGTTVLEVLRGANLDLAPGEIVALVGQSGAGKSTLLHIAGLLERPDGGTVLIDGRDCGGLGETARTELRRRHLGFVYQYHHLLAEFSARENIMLPQMIAGMRREAARTRADELLSLIGLTDRAEHRPARLSGGEQQRVAVARALANRPAVLLADEPTGNLDAETAEAVLAVLLDLVREAGMTALIATHNMDLATRLDRILMLRNGALVAG